MTQSIISVFGSARPEPGSRDYQQAERIGQLLAERGFAVATGGYIGTMEAVSKGAYEAGGHVIGVTSRRIEAYRPIAPNPFLHEEVKYDTLRDRLIHLVTHNVGMVVLPGGIGTLAELSMAWNGLQTGELGRERPFVALGELWQATLQTFFDQNYIRTEDFGRLKFALEPEEAVSYIAERVAL